MLTIRKSQINRFDEICLDNFCQKIITFLQNNYKSFTKGKQQNFLMFEVREKCRKAISHGINKENDLLRYMQFIAESESIPKFHNDKNWVKKILSEEKLSGTEKMDKIEDKLLTLV